ncbi:MAG: aldehyde ferredoxin oxidoreductase family protein [Mycobacteriaceae bacterium]
MSEPLHPQRNPGAVPQTDSGLVLTVDLSTGEVLVEQTPPDERRRYAGGGLMGVRRLLIDTPPGLDPFAPDALVTFWSSVVAGHPAVGLPRCAVVAKSPLTGGIGEARVTGPFGLGLRAAGFDGIVVRGRAEVPAYLLVRDGSARVVDAPELWGADTGLVTDMLKNRHGEQARVAAIGPAGERLVRFAGIVAERTHPAARMGLGAVMGAKQLKAVVIVPSAPPAPHDPGELAEITAAYAARMSSNPMAATQHDVPGFGAWPLEANLEGYAGGTNYRTSVLPGFPSLTKEALADRVTQSEGGCPGCPNDCIKRFDNSFDERAGGLDEELLAAFGLGLGITDLDSLLDLNARCHLWGVDPVSLAFTVSFLCETAERGLLPEGMLPGPAPRFGAVERLLPLLEAIALRRPGYEWLGEGAQRAAARIGPGVTCFAMHVKGLEMVSFDPRASAGQALAYAVSPLGPRYDIVEHDIDFDPVDGYSNGLDQMRTLGTTDWEPMAALDEGRVGRTAVLLDMWSGLDALCVCLFAGPPIRELTLPTVARLVHAVTGWASSDAEIFLWGRRRLQLMRVYNLREGLTAETDTLPDRFFDDPVDAGRHRGEVLRRSAFNTAVRQYYELVGWDDQGVPRRSTLAALGLAWAVPTEASTPDTDVMHTTAEGLRR